MRASSSGRWRRLRRLVGAVLLVILLILVHRVAATSRDLPAGGTAVVAIPSDLQALDPALTCDRSTWRVLSCVYETLVRPGPEPGQVRPGLATSWEVSADGLRYTMHLRRDVRFHDGRPLTASAVARSLLRQLDPKAAASRFGGGRFVFLSSLLGGTPPRIQRIIPWGTGSVRIELRQPVRDLLEILAHPPCAVVAPTVASSSGRSSPVGTGPYRFVENRPGQRVTLESNPGYWGGRPPLDNLVFTVVPQAAARQRELVRGNADLATAVDLLQVDSLKAAGLVVSPAGGLNSWSLVMNCSRHPWSDLRSRVALQHALPRVKLARMFGGTRSVAATGMLSPRSRAWDPGERGYAWDPARARRLLARIRLPRAMPMALLFPTASPVVADTAGLAGRVADGLASVGLAVRPQPVTAEELEACLARGGFDLALRFEEQGRVDADLELYPDWSRENSIPGGTNVSRFSSGHLQELLDLARTDPDARRRNRLYREVQQHLNRAAPRVPLAWSLEVTAHRRRLRGVTVDRLGILDFSGAWLGFH